MGNRSDKRLLLVVDDEEGARAALANLLSGAGYAVLTAGDGDAALASCARIRPDAVITDLRMPGMDGLELIARLRARNLDMPAIVATAASDVPSALGAIRAGATDYLTKPVDADALTLAIERALDKDALEREAAALRACNAVLVAEAEENLRAREQLLAIVAHDLRGPIANIMLAAEAMEAGDDGRKLQIVQRAAKRMKQLVNDLLDSARIEMGTLNVEVRPTFGSAILREAAAQLEAVAEARGVRVFSMLAADFCVDCAFDRIVQVVVNLASNAVEVTPRGGNVRVIAERCASFGRFSVIDEGPGIDRELLPRVFERGWRGARSKGAGLGLSIARGIVEAHGGIVAVESRVGAGSTFRFEIPLRGPDRASWRVAGSSAPERPAAAAKR